MKDDFDMMEVDLVMMDDDQNVITFVITLKTRAVWIHLNVLKLLGIIKVRC